jgi:hypothetical protein
MTDSGVHDDNDLLDLYALGSLSRTESARVEQHVFACAACRERFNSAQEAVTSLIDAGETWDAPQELRQRIAVSTPARQRPGLQSWMAVAAAFLLGVIPAAWLYGENQRVSSVTAMQSSAISSLVHSHFSHAPFQSIDSNAPSAKVIFPRDGSWFYVVIASPASGLQVGTVTNSQTRVLGNPAGLDQSSAFYDSSPGTIDNLVILRDGRVVARAPFAVHRR